MIQVTSLNDLNASSSRRLRENTTITNPYDGSPALGIVRAVNEVAYELLLDLQSSEIANKISQASGSDLDVYGEILGLNRADSTFASDLSYGNFKFYYDTAFGTGAQFNQLITRINTHFASNERLPNPGATLTFPAGTEITSSTDSSIRYITLDAATISADNLTSYVRVSSNVVGKQGNVGQGVLDTWTSNDPYLKYATDIIRCTNLQDISTGQAELSDTEYRFRLINQVTGSVTSNMTAVRIAALSVPGVSDVIIKPWTHGIGTLTVFPIVSATMVQQGILNAVQAAVDTIKAAGNKVYVMAPIYIGITMNINVNFKLDVPILDRERILNTIRTNTVNYINNIQIGGELLITDIIAAGKNVDPGVRDIMIAMMTGGELNTTTLVIPNPEFLIITNQLLRYNEKFYTTASLISVCEV